MPLKLKYSLLVAFILGVWCLHTYDKNKAVEAAKSVLISEYNEKLLKANAKATAVQTEMQTGADKQKEEKDAKIKELDTKLAATLNELRKRPKRPPDNTQDSTTSKACTASSLYAEDAEFLAREAARADSILLERDYYYSEYESVRRTLDSLTNK